MFSYKVSSWDKTKLEAVAELAMGECLGRRLVIHLPDKSAALSWSPPTGCEGDKGRAVLVGDDMSAKMNGSPKLLHQSIPHLCFVIGQRSVSRLWRLYCRYTLFWKEGWHRWR